MRITETAIITITATANKALQDYYSNVVLGNSQTNHANVGNFDGNDYFVFASIVLNQKSITIVLSYNGTMIKYRHRGYGYNELYKAIQRTIGKLFVAMRKVQ